MPFPAQVALSLELAKIFPIKAVINNGAESLVSLVRALKRTGSDFLVEEDLAAIFGRGRIEDSLEDEFRTVVKDASFTPLYPESTIELDARPGPTVGRALKNRLYMSFIIQMSFLGWMHEETTLATTLTESMLTRYEAGVDGATPDPDYDGILKVLQACSSQTSQYNWNDLVIIVESRFQNSRSWFRRHGSPLRHLTPNLLLGAMDYLYMVQALPDDRLVVVEGQAGLTSIVVWAHYILGMTVLVQKSPDGDVKFGSSSQAQVIIRWNHDLPLTSSPLSGLAEHSRLRVSPPTIYLLDADMQVLLKVEASENDGVRIEGQECHRLKGYGTTFLQRIFNSKTMITDDDPIYTETADYAVAFAILISRLMRRVPFREGHNRNSNKNPDIPGQCYLNTEHWRLFSSGRLLFFGIDLNKNEIIRYIDKLSHTTIESMVVPTSVRSYLQKLDENTYEELKLNFIQETKQVASWILTFAQVVDIEACAEVPLRMAPSWMFCTGVLNWDGLSPIDIDSDIWFNLVLKMMRKDTTGGESLVDSEGLFLVSYNGWSIFHSSVGDYDPEGIDCELLCLKRGVPTNTRTGERKYRIADAPAIEHNVRVPVLLEKGDAYRPRCVTKICKRSERYVSRSDEFWLSIRFDIEEVDFHARTPIQRAGQDARYSLYASHAQFHKALWGVVKTRPCPHRHENSEDMPLDLDAVTVTGLTWGNGNGLAGETRICICLVKGDARARWLVVNGIMPNSEPGTLNRQVLLRCDGCCEDCAVKAASAMPGKWLVVL